MFSSHFSSNPLSVNLSADFLARFRMAKVSSLLSESAFWYPSAYSWAVEAWNPVRCQLQYNFKQKK